MKKRQTNKFLRRIAKFNYCLIQFFAGTIILMLIWIPQIGNSQTNNCNYRLNRSDYFIVPAVWTIGLALKYTVKPGNKLTQEEIGALTLNPVFAIDNFALDKYNPTIDKISDVAVGISLFAPLLLSVPALNENNWQQIASLNMMYAEVLGITFSMAEFSKIAVHRIRPYMYNTNLSVDERFQLNTSGDGEKSFYSMHTAFAFSSAVFLSKIYADCYGKTTSSKWIWAGSLGFATAVGISRIYSGQHFPTDVITGALIGSITGYLVPALHRINQNHTSCIITPNGIRVTLRI